LRLADPIEHEGLLHRASLDAQLLLQQDPQLVSDRGKACACCCGFLSGPRRCERCWRDRWSVPSPQCSSRVRTGQAASVQRL
jgi:hypothetical protein